MKTWSKNGIFVVILVALGILGLFTYTWQVESARARAIQGSVNLLGHKPFLDSC
jgi:predicted negative regulator of RcsB-dependent stress response